ncbi:MAG: membrane protein insertase YidC [Desulfuromonadaceae bacterium]|nr:membrane protein insertase YidC [Desulfuromonadaceae bacterium]MDD2854256.1 membrane protein insertase YidC [Desulfuromonadaceae bacterium]
MEKRTIIAVGLSIAVFYIFSMLFGPEKSSVDNPVPQKTVSSEIKEPATNIQEVQKQVSTSTQSVPTYVEQKDIIVETELYKAVFSSRGASLKSMTLKKYREKNVVQAKNVALGNDSDPAVYEFSTRASGFNFSDNSQFSADAENIKLEDSTPRKLTFTCNSGQGYIVRKIYTFFPDSYGITLETEILNNSAAPLTGAFQHIMTYPAEPKVKDNRFDTAGAYLFSDGTLQTNKIKDVSNSSKRYDKSILWSAFADKYFISSILGENNSIASVELKKNAAGFFESIVSSPQFTVDSGKSTKVTHRIFVGPKDIDILKQQGNSLERSLDLGWFTVIAKPLLYTLKFFYKFVGNYGIAIIIITIILKAIFFPLTHKSYKSMKGMQKIQPEMTKLREKYKDDRDAMNKAVMELYKEHKVNPMGGCLPMIVQIPVFFALYKSLMFSIELRHAPFFFWITDLADKDPYYITPVIMGVTMFIQQKMTPSQMEPMQQKMMLALPVVFTFMFLSFPSGLVLYWLVNNILTIGQQMYINKLVED